MRRMLIALSAVALVSFGCGQSADETAQDAADTAQDVGDEVADEAGDAADRAEDMIDDVEVKITGFAFNPASIEAKVGQQVEWTNNDDATHTITSDNNVFDSKEKSKGETFEHRFTQAGDYPYHCNIHSSMKGTVSVT